jgi:Icc-related predicted phosphoesterase
MNLPETKIQFLKTRPGQRILVTGDIHGHPKHLEKVLEKAGFCKDDLLIILGAFY